MREVKTCPDIVGQTNTSMEVSYLIEVDDTEAIPVDSDQDDLNQLARELLKMQSAFGFRSQSEMLEEYFGGDMNAMVKAAKQGGSQ